MLLFFIFDNNYDPNQNLSVAQIFCRFISCADCESPLKENNCAILYWNSYINIEVMVQITGVRFVMNFANFRNSPKYLDTLNFGHQ